MLPGCFECWLFVIDQSDKHRKKRFHLEKFKRGRMSLFGCVFFKPHLSWRHGLSLRKNRKRKTVSAKSTSWNEAQSFCREHHTDLAPVSNEQDNLKLGKLELKKHNTTELGWIGLRFLPGDWLWVDGQEMEYEAWGERGKPTCPHPKMKCAAIQATGGTESPIYFLKFI
uniref:C-type lectin domain-containing protein n=1 Tax=Oreochromis aureus TaxID=47969 RepID=A0A668VJ17_OREAU